MSNYSALLIDNKKENNDLLIKYLEKYFKEIVTIYSATSFEEGVELFLEVKPDILIIDTEFSSGETAFDLLNVYPTGTSEVVFISASEKFALEAINQNNVSGYLLKPLKKETFINAISKAILNVDRNKAKVSSKSVTENNKFLAVTSNNKIDLLHVDEISFCAADGRYTIFETSNNKKITSSKSIGEYQAVLCPLIFYRVHNKFIVNIKLVKTVHKTNGFFCEMLDGTMIPVSKRKQNEFFRFIKSN